MWLLLSAGEVVDEPEEAAQIAHTEDMKQSELRILAVGKGRQYDVGIVTADRVETYLDVQHVIIVVRKAVVSPQSAVADERPVGIEELP